ncbi:hypothetical protein [Kibdelosporangium philippinense]|uniref:hypothetical protein n=1 Tax=Kibdelosporangium philippinense TaxID=211113 RepID=UPI00361E2CF4
MAHDAAGEERGGSGQNLAGEPSGNRGSGEPSRNQGASKPTENRRSSENQTTCPGSEWTRESSGSRDGLGQSRRTELIARPSVSGPVHSDIRLERENAPHRGTRRGAFFSL